MSKHTSLNAIVMMYATGEIVILARHQLEILERRFPNYEHSIHILESSDNCMIVSSYKNYLLQISFYPSSIEILSTFGDEEAIVLDYADPKFTDDTISDKLKEWEVGHVNSRL